MKRQQQAASPGERIHVLVQFWQIPSGAERATLENAGVELLAYVPANTWFVSMPAGLSLQSDALAGVRWIGAIQPEDRMAPTLQAGGIGPHATHDDGTVSLDVRFFANVTTAEGTQLLARYDGVIETKAPEFHRFTVRLDPRAISSLAGEDSVQWIAEAAPPKTTDNDGARARTNVDAVQSAPYNLSGSGTDLGIWDAGRVDTHVDFSGRLTVVDAGASVHDHATHVAGTMAGDGSNSASQGGSPLQWRGMAPGADIISYYWDNNLSDHNGAINTYGIELSQNSWGYTIGDGPYYNCYLYGNYDYDAPDYDDIITGRYGKRIGVIFAAGNERDDGDCGMSSTPPYINYANIGPPATAKNVIAVGATNSNDDSMTSFSSWGPMDDGRIKPDVVAPGCESTGEGYIHSTLPGNIYGGPGWCGTSMAAPVVSGISALLIQQYRTTFGADPLPSTLKALLVQTAVDMDDGTSYYNPGPDYASGYGRVDAQAAVDEVIAQHIREDYVSHGQTDSFTVNVPAGTPSLKVTLAWDDEPGAVNANPALVNNLDLILVEPNGTTTHLPWVLDPANPSNDATSGTDSINNVEQAQVNNPVAGTWQVQVGGTSVPMGTQDYSLAGQTFTPGGGNTPPTISGLPDQTLPVNTSRDNAIDLWAYASDAEDSDSDLNFTISNSPDTNAGVSIDSSNRYIDINPTTDWTGATDVEVQVEDTGHLTDTDSFQVTVVAVASFPFCDGFESGSLGTGWTTHTTNEGRVQVSSSHPYSGTYSVLLDDSTENSTHSYAAIILTIDLSSQSDVDLDFWWRDFGDEDHADDGVFLSDDWGTTWFTATNFAGSQNSFKNEVVDVDTIAAANGLTLNDHFQIKFQFYDNQPITSDGYAIDEVCVQTPSLPDIEVSPTFFGETGYEGEMATKTLTINNTGDSDLDFSIQERDRGFQPTLMATGPFAESKPLVPPEYQQAATTEGLALPLAPAGTILAAGDVIQSWSSGLAAAWGIAYDSADDTVWVGSPVASWGGDGNDYEYQTDGTATGRVWPVNWGASYGPADMAFNWNTGMAWHLDVGGDDCLHELDPANGFTGVTICGPWTVSQRGLAYDPATDTWYVGGWNENTIYHIDSSGTLLDSAYVGLGISGLAYNPDTQHLFAQVNGGTNDVYVLDASAPGVYPQIGQFHIGTLASGAGLEIDCNGNLWAVDQSNEMVIQAESDETTSLCTQDVPWLSENPTSGTVPAGSSLPVDVTFNATGLAQGDYTASLIIYSNDLDENPVTVPVVLHVLAGGGGTSSKNYLPIILKNHPDSGRPPPP